MKKTMPSGLELCRLRDGLMGSDETYGFNGAFTITHQGARLRLVVSDQAGWDHVSVSLADRCPTWDEMCFIKDLFFDPHETVVQYHPARADYINQHPYCLHLWRRQGREHQLPPSWMVGIP